MCKRRMCMCWYQYINHAKAIIELECYQRATSNIERALTRIQEPIFLLQWNRWPIHYLVMSWFTIIIMKGDVMKFGHD